MSIQHSQIKPLIRNPNYYLHTTVNGGVGYNSKVYNNSLKKYGKKILKMYAIHETVSLTNCTLA